MPSPPQHHLRILAAAVLLSFPRPALLLDPAPYTDGQAFAGSGGAFVSLISMLNPAAQGRTAFFTGAGVCEAASAATTPTEAYYPALAWTLHPTRATMEGSLVLGAVVANVVCVTVVYVLCGGMAEGLSCAQEMFPEYIAPFVRGGVVRRGGDAHGALYNPSIAVTVCTLLYQGTALAAFRALASAGDRDLAVWHALVGLVGLGAVVAFPLYIYRRVVVGAAAGVCYRPAPNRREHRLVTYFVGEGEWVSTRLVPRDAQRYRAVIHPYTPDRTWWLCVEYVWSFTLAATACGHLTTRAACCSGKVATALVTAAFTAATALARPYRRGIDTALFMVVNWSHTAAAGILAVGACAKPMDVPGGMRVYLKWSDVFIAFAGVVLAGKALLDVVIFVYVRMSGRWTDAQAAEDGVYTDGSERAEHDHPPYHADVPAPRKGSAPDPVDTAGVDAGVPDSSTGCPPPHAVGMSADARGLGDLWVTPEAYWRTPIAVGGAAKTPGAARQRPKPLRQDVHPAASNAGSAATTQVDGALKDMGALEEPLLAGHGGRAHARAGRPVVVVPQEAAGGGVGAAAQRRRGSRRSMIQATFSEMLQGRPAWLRDRLHPTGGPPSAASTGAGAAGAGTPEDEAPSNPPKKPSTSPRAPRFCEQVPVGSAGSSVGTSGHAEGDDDVSSDAVSSTDRHVAAALEDVGQLLLAARGAAGDESGGNGRALVQARARMHELVRERSQRREARQQQQQQQVLDGESDGEASERRDAGPTPLFNRPFGGSGVGNRLGSSSASGRRPHTRPGADSGFEPLLTPPATGVNGVPGDVAAFNAARRARIGTPGADAPPLVATSIFADTTQFDPAPDPACSPGRSLLLSPLNPNVRPVDATGQPVVPLATASSTQVPLNTTEVTCVAVDGAWDRYEL